MTFKHSINTMQTKITKIEWDKPELIEIHCHTLNDEVREIIALRKDRFSSFIFSSNSRLLSYRFTYWWCLGNVSCDIRYIFCEIHTVQETQKIIRARR